MTKKWHLTWLPIADVKLPPTEEGELHDEAYRETTRDFAINTLLPDIQRVGMWCPLLIRKDNRQIVDGVARYLALAEIGYRGEVPVVWFTEGQHDKMLAGLCAKIAAINARLLRRSTDQHTDAMIAFGRRSGLSVRTMVKKTQISAKEIEAAIARVGENFATPLISMHIICGAESQRYRSTDDA